LYPLRGPLLMRVEIAADRLRRDTAASGSDRHSLVAALVQRIIEYGDEISAGAACAFSDLGPYLGFVLDDIENTEHNKQSILDLLEWAKRICIQPSNADARSRRSELRTYIFAIQVTYKILDRTQDDYVQKQEWMPAWMDLLRVWQSFQEFDTVTDQDQVRPISLLHYHFGPFFWMLKCL